MAAHASRITRVRLIVRGRVQGVGFRWFIFRRARTLHLDGTVWNRQDGAVEIEAEGAREALADLISAARGGPPNARVAEVEETWSEGPARHRGFSIEDGIR